MRARVSDAWETRRSRVATLAWARRRASAPRAASSTSGLPCSGWSRSSRRRRFSSGDVTADRRRRRFGPRMPARSISDFTMLTARFGRCDASLGRRIRPRTSGADGNQSGSNLPVKPLTPTTVGRGFFGELSSFTTTASWARRPVGMAITSPRRSRRSMVTVSTCRSSMLRRFADFSSAEIADRKSR